MSDEAWKELKDLYIDLQDEINTLEVINDANIGEIRIGDALTLHLIAVCIGCGS